MIIQGEVYGQTENRSESLDTVETEETPETVEDFDIEETSDTDETTKIEETLKSEETSETKVTNSSPETTAAETTPTASDSLKFDYSKNPFGIQIGVDLVKLGSFAIDQETKYEALAGISYKNLTLVAEAGHSLFAYRNSYKNSEDYEVEGGYFRVGLDYAFSKGAKNQILVGVRYAKASFGDRGSFITKSELWEDFTYTLDADTRNNSTATWGEVVVGTQTLIFKNAYFGWYFRFRKLFERTEYDPIDIFYIPGYGKSFNNSIPALNLFLKYKISF